MEIFLLHSKPERGDIEMLKGIVLIYDDDSQLTLFKRHGQIGIFPDDGTFEARKFLKDLKYKGFVTDPPWMKGSGCIFLQPHFWDKFFSIKPEAEDFNPLRDSQKRFYEYQKKSR